MSNKEFNERYIDPDYRLQREKLEREVAQSRKNAPLPPETPKPDYNWKPWEKSHGDTQMEQMKKLPESSTPQ